MPKELGNKRPLLVAEITSSTLLLAPSRHAPSRALAGEHVHRVACPPQQTSMVLRSSLTPGASTGPERMVGTHTSRRHLLQRLVGLTIAVPSAALLSACTGLSAWLAPPTRLPLVGYLDISDTPPLNFAAFRGQ